ncbi:MAG: urease accessory UreF family protein [Actinomycetota bacterium]
MLTSLGLLLADGRLPTGGHTTSAGVEAAVRAGDVHDLPSVERYLAGRLATSGLVDASFAAMAAGIAADAITVDTTAADTIAGATITAESGAAGADETGALDPDTADGVWHRLDAEYAARLLSPHLREVSRSLGRQLHRTATALLHALDVAPARLVSAAGRHRPLVAGALMGDLGGDEQDGARLELHHLAGSVTGASIKLLGLDPLAAAGVQARAAASIEQLVGIAVDAVRSAGGSPSRLPAAGGSLTEILGDAHGRSTHRMFAA